MEPVDVTKAAETRKQLMNKVREESRKGNKLTSQLVDLEYLGRNFFLGIDHDEDMSDLEDVYWDE